MPKKLMALLIILLLISTVGCGSKVMSKSESSMEDQRSAGMSNKAAAPASAKAQATTTASGISLDSIDKKIIKNAEVNITVKNNPEAETKVQEMVVKYQGFVQNTSTYTSKESSRTDMEVRVPADKFDPFLAELKSIGEVTYNRVFTTDVTEEFIDLSARQKTLKLQEERLQEMLKQAKNVDELLKVENEIARIRGEIERITGRLKYLENKTSYSTVVVHLSTKYIPSEAEINNFGERLLYNLKDGFGTFLNLIMGLVNAAAWLLPFLIIAGPIAYFLRNKYRNRGLGK